MIKTIFLDRDGVINKHLPGDYVKSVKEFEFLPSSLEAIKILYEKGFRIIVITNQQGIGKGLMSINDLEQIHNYMLDKIKGYGGNIHKIYYCPHLAEENCNCRKPKTGMIEQALNDFPDIHLSEAILIGDSETDIILAKNVGIRSLLISNSHIENHLCFKSLFAAVNYIIKSNVILSKK